MANNYNPALGYQKMEKMKTKTGQANIEIKQITITQNMATQLSPSIMVNDIIMGALKFPSELVRVRSDTIDHLVKIL